MDKRTILSEYTTYAAHQRAAARARYQALLDEALELRTAEQAYQHALKDLAHKNALGEDTAELEKKAVCLGKERDILLAQYLAEHQYPADYLEIRYRCTRCRDTGYLGEERRVLCPCVLERLKQAQPKPPSLKTFEDFREELIPAGKQRESANKLKEYFEGYVDGFDGAEKPSFLLAGPTGLGKTFFLQCVVSGLRQKGVRCRFLTAYELNEEFKRQHIQGEPTVKRLVEVPFLAIDDLGTEPIYNNITLEYLFTLLNERSLRKKHTGIATNLCDPQQLADRYGERITSRMTDVRTTRLIALKGEDLRHHRG